MCIRDRDYNTNPSSQRWNYRLNTDIDVTKTTLVKVGVSGSLKKRNAPGQGSNVRCVYETALVLYDHPSIAPREPTRLRSSFNSIEHHNSRTINISLR